MNTKIQVNGKTINFKVSPYNAKKSIPFYRNKIIEAFKKIGVEEKYIEISFGGAGGHRVDSWAMVEWVVNGETFNYKCDSQQADVDNVAAIAQVIENDCKAIRRGLKSFGMVMNQFRIGYNPDAPKIKTPREILGIPGTVMDPEYVIFKFKQLSKKHHPDVGGDPKEFDKIWKAKDDLLKELKESER